MKKTGRIRSIRHVRGPGLHRLPGDTGPVGAGSLADVIERGVLAPIRRLLPSAAPLIDRVSNCGGCKADNLRAQGKGGGSTI